MAMWRADDTKTETEIETETGRRVEPQRGAGTGCFPGTGRAPRRYNFGVNPLVELRTRPWGFLEIALAVALVAWRCAAPTWHPFYRDILFYLGLYWIFLVLVPESSPARTPVTIGMMMLALGIYATGQMPHMLLSLDLLPP
jgi:hypothetical protein